MTEQLRQDIIEDFIQFVKNKLDIDQLPTIRFLNDREWATEKRSFGEYNPNKNHLDVYIHTCVFLSLLKKFFVKIDGLLLKISHLPNSLFL